MRELIAAAIEDFIFEAPLWAVIVVIGTIMLGTTYLLTQLLLSTGYFLPFLRYGAGFLLIVWIYRIARSWNR